MAHQHLEITREGAVATLWLNRPDKLNALSADMWAEIPDAMAELDDDDDVRVVVLAGRGRAFCVGIDVELLATLQPTGPSPAAGNLELYRTIKRLQQTVSCFAETAKPVIAAIHGYCLGAGVNLISACDIRLATVDAVLSIRETRMGLVADIGALQRLPAIVGNGVTAEMALTGADYPASWALQRGLVNSIHDDQEALLAAAGELAHVIAANSPLVTQGIKRILQANDGRTVEQALDYVAQWNSSFLVSNDLMEAMSAFIDKRDPKYTGT
ncbi:MAG TPA: crotonase/enoyl-CoA hydratase family protein [Acidimicrobiia bacterium]|jgi:enoyl-CoA hydratase|nr:crotonase/enoyl-CoA hydratase family protein [Acidimicrobiia bacterium]